MKTPKQIGMKSEISTAKRPAQKHRFILLVKNNGDRKSAALAVLFAFSKREPDGCEFYIQ